MSKSKYNQLSSLRVPPEIHHRVKSLAALKGRSVASLARELLEPAVAAEEAGLDRLRARERPDHGRPVK
jgi:predicted DNA-binding protein